MSLQKIKRMFGALDLNTIKSFVKNTKRGIDILKRVDKIADDHDIQFVKRITDRVLENKNFKRLETGLEVGNRLIGAVEQSKKSGFFNKNKSDINEEGKRVALERRKSLMNKERISTNPVKPFTDDEERQLAENIGASMKYKN